MTDSPFVDALLGPLAKATVLPFYKRRLDRFKRTLATARETQSANMLGRLQRSADTAFGRDHGFSRLAGLQDYRRTVPIQTYETLQPYMARVLRGETGALLPPDDEILALTCTTGSTGEPKVLPLTRSWLREYRAAWEIWGAQAVTDHVGIIGKGWLQLSGPANVMRTENGQTVGMLSAASARHMNPVVHIFYVTPFDTGDIPDADDRNYTVLRLAIPSRVGNMMTITPANLIRLAETGDQHRDALIRDVHDGTLRCAGALDPKFLGRIARRVARKDPVRARELEAIVERTGTLYPKDYWPLRMIGCWLGGTVGYQASRLPTYYGCVAVRDLGLISTEGRHTIPLMDTAPEGVLDPSGAYYEFAPEGETGQNRATLEAHELEAGRTYTPIISTSNGLFRYDLADVVKCKGYIGQAPILEFLHKSEQYSDMEGEKISSYQMACAVEGAYAKCGMEPDQFAALPQREGKGGARYGIMVEASSHLGNAGAVRQFLGHIDAGLAAQNIMYRQKRGDRSIGAPSLMELEAGSWSRHAAHAGRQWGTGDTQHKHPALLKQDCWPEGAVLVRETQM